jgi:hypothetical protein
LPHSFDWADCGVRLRAARMPKAQSSSLPREVFRRSFVSLRPLFREWGKPQARKARAARDAGDLPVSTVHVRKEKHTELSSAGTGSSPDVPRAVFNRPYPCLAPAELPSLPFGRGPFIRRWRDPSPARSCLGHGKRQTRRPLWRAVSAPGTAGFSRRDGFAKPATATAPDPHSKTPLETPLVDRDARRIRPPEGLGISFRKYFRVEIALEFKLG